LLGRDYRPSVCSWVCRYRPSSAYIMGRIVGATSYPCSQTCPWFMRILPNRRTRVAGGTMNITDFVGVGLISILIGTICSFIRSAFLSIAGSIIGSVIVCWAWYWLPELNSDVSNINSHRGWDLIVIAGLSVVAVPIGLITSLGLRVYLRSRR